MRRKADTLLFGAATYEVMAAYCPTALRMKSPTK